MNLVIELRAGESMMINGATIHFVTKTRLRLTEHARLMFGKQIMQPENATTTTRRIYLALQNAYVGPDDKRAAAHTMMYGLVADYTKGTISWQVSDMLERIVVAAKSGEYYKAIKLVRWLIEHEERANDISQGANVDAGSLIASA